VDAGSGGDRKIERAACGLPAALRDERVQAAALPRCRRVERQRVEVILDCASRRILIARVLSSAAMSTPK
jgi:hypothetical protein